MKLSVKCPLGRIVALILRFGGAVLKELEGHFSSNAVLLGKNRHCPLITAAFVTRLSPNFIPVGRLSLKVGKGHRSIERHFMGPHHPLCVTEREEKSDSIEALSGRSKNMYPLSNYCLPTMCSPLQEVHQTRSQILPGEENMNKEAPQVGHVINFQDGKNNRSQNSGRKRGSESALGAYSAGLENCIL